jgi:hypothetical protein
MSHFTCLDHASGQNLSGRTGWLPLAEAARTERPQIVVRVNSRAVAIVPPEFDGIVTDAADLLQPGVGNGNEIYLRPVPLAQCARAVPTKIGLRIVSDVAIIPRDSDESISFNMINFSRPVHFQDLAF